MVSDDSPIDAVLPTGSDPDPRRGHWIIVDVICGAAVLRGADIFVPGILGASGTNHSIL